MNEERLLKIILAPHLSEKAAIATEKHKQYVFEVIADATKPEIKGAVELLFKAQVENVRIVNVKSKPRRFGSREGSTKKWKKAYVSLKAGQEINIAGGQ